MEKTPAHGGQEVGVASSTVGGQGPGLPGGCKKASSKRVCGHGQCCEAASRPDPSAREATPKIDANERKVRRKQRQVMVV